MITIIVLFAMIMTLINIIVHDWTSCIYIWPLCAYKSFLRVYIHAFVCWIVFFVAVRIIIIIINNIIIIIITTLLSHWDSLHGKFGLLSPGKASCDKVALPNLELCWIYFHCFRNPPNFEVWHELQDLYRAYVIFLHVYAHVGGWGLGLIVLSEGLYHYK